MSTPETMRAIHHLMDLSRTLDHAVEDLRRLEEISVDAESDYKLAWARAYQEAVGSVEARKAAATIACDSLFRTWRKAEAAVGAQKAHIRALHTRIDVGRTIQATARSEMALGGLIP